MPRNQTKPFAGPGIWKCRSTPILPAEFYMLGEESPGNPSGDGDVLPGFDQRRPRYAA
jgi:hypothetical protein